MRKFLKVLLIIFCCLVIILASSVLWLNTNSGMNFVRTRAEAYLRDKLKTEVHVTELGYGLPKFIVLTGVLFRDQAKDTLLSVGKLEINLDMLALLHKSISVQKITLENATANIYRHKQDSTFNFSYIIAAFASPTAAPAKKSTKSAPLKINVDQLALTNIRFRFADSAGGDQLLLSLGRLNIKMKTLDLDSMLFHVKELAMGDVKVNYLKDSSYLSVVAKKPSSKAQLRLIADKIDLQNVTTHYNDNLNKFLFDLGLGKLQLGIKNFDLEHDLVAISQLKMDNSTVVFKMGNSSKPPAIIDTIIDRQEQHGWTVNAGNVQMNQVNFKMDNESSKHIPAGIDYSHLNVQDIVMSMDNFLFASDTIMGNIKHMVAKEQCGLVINELRSDFLYNNEGAVLNNLLLKTPNTLLNDHIEVHYESLQKLAAHPESLQLKLNFKNSIIGIADVLTFAPFLVQQEFIKEYKTGKINIDADIAGSVGKLNINKLNLTGFDRTEIVLNGKLSGLPDPKKLNYDFNITRLKSTSKMLAFFVPPAQLSSVRVPEDFLIVGKISGSTLDYNPDLAIKTPDGNLKIKGYLHLSPGAGKEKYDLVVNTTDLNAGKIFKQDTLIGKFTATITARGIGFDPKTMASVFTGNIKSASFKEYPYTGITFNGKVFNKKGDLSLTSNDPSASLQFTGHADFSSKYIAAIIDAKIDSLDFQELNLYKDPFRIHGTIHADFPELNPDYPRGVFTWKDPVISVNGQRYVPDSIIIASAPSADTGQNIYAYIDVLQARITGKIPLTKIPAILESNIKRHYNTLLVDTTKNNVIAISDSSHVADAYNLNLLATITDKPIIHGFLPKLTSFDSVHIDASITEHQLDVNLIIPKVVYDSNTLQKAIVQVRGTDSSLIYKANIDRVTYSGFDLWYTDIQGNVDHDSITTSISLSDAERKERFALAAEMHQLGNERVIQLKPGLVLDYNTWLVAQPNSITIKDSGYYINNFVITRNEQSIKINSEQQAPNATVRADITNFSLRNITGAISKSDTVLAEGVLSGYATYTNSKAGPVITSDLQIKDLVVLNDTLGDLKALVSNKDPQVLDAKILLAEHGNDLAITGNYFLQQQNGNDFDLALKIDRLNLRSFESIAQNKMKNSSGIITGDLKIVGTIAAPRVTGELKTKNLVTTISEVNGTYKMPDEKIVFNEGIVSLPKFTIYDSAGNKAIISGDVNIQDLANPYFNLNLNAKNWRAIHSRKEDNKIFFGDLYFSSNLNVVGTLYAPTVDGNISILKGTDLTVVTPESNPELESSKGIVVFRNMRDSNLRKPLANRKKDSTQNNKIAKGSSVNLNVTIDKKAQLSLVLDQATGDFIKVRGVATLNTYLMPDGTIGLTGNYELSEGAYQLNYNFIKRRFNIRAGSSIIFAGDPVKGTNLNVTAVYSANIAPYDLVQKEIQDPLQLNYFKQKLPFDVELHMKGAVLQPSLTFDIVLPDNKVYPLSSDQIELIHGKLNQLHGDTSQLNKQVFAVLLLSRFVADDPFSNGASTSVSNTALQSVSRFIGEQLNQVAGRLVKGVDLSVDLATTDDYTTGDLRQRTDLSLAASKRLLNDRLKLTLGNDFELDGPQASKSDQNNLVPSNLSADYALSADGRYTLRAYRKNYNEGVLQGYVTESGLDFIVNLDYNNFKSIFKKRNKKDNDTKN